MIAIVGGGWFGCHIGCVLKDRGVPFQLFETKKRLFDGASGYNQNRLHQGFHYPQGAETRRQSRDGFFEFVQRYPQLCAEVQSNIYAITNESLIDYVTYMDVMTASMLAYTEVEPADYGLENIEGAIACGERVVLTNRARSFFTERLAGKVRHQRFTDLQARDFETIIDCSYQTWQPAFVCIYEPCCTLLYSAKTEEAKAQAITLMDGPFTSIYPYDAGVFTVYSVVRSRIAGAKCVSAEAAQSLLIQMDTKQLAGIRSGVEADVRVYYPSFLDHYEFAGWHGSVRAISRSKSDARVCAVRKESNVIHVMSGKIDSIFHAEREVLKCLDMA